MNFTRVSHLKSCDLSFPVDPDWLRLKETHETPSAAPVRKLLVNPAQLTLLTVAHCPDLTLGAQHDQVIHPGGDLDDVNCGQDLDRELFDLHSLDQADGSATVPEGSPEVDLARVREGRCVAVSGTEHHDLL